jgi:hypothetical protein
VPEYDFAELGFIKGRGHLTWGTAVREYKALPLAPAGSVRLPIFIRASGGLYKPSDFDRAAEQLLA